MLSYSSKAKDVSLHCYQWAPSLAPLLYNGTNPMYLRWVLLQTGWEAFTSTQRPDACLMAASSLRSLGGE